jgi:F-type H+-transporting ATPase subunit b
VELNWSTFILEIINFLVLVWILKRFLYKPVLEMIARRRASIDKTLADAKQLHDDAEKLQQQYEGRLADWDQERKQAREKLAEELHADRARKLEELKATLKQERERAAVAEKRRLADERLEMEDTALAHGAQLATQLLKQAAGPEVESKLVELAIDELSKLSKDRLADLRGSFGQVSEGITITSAYPIPENQQQRLQKAVNTVAGKDTPLRFEQDSKLLAGVRINIGAWQLAANLRDELKGFAELHETRAGD